MDFEMFWADIALGGSYGAHRQLLNGLRCSSLSRPPNVVRRLSRSLMVPLNLALSTWFIWFLRLCRACTPKGLNRVPSFAQLQYLSIC